MRASISWLVVVCATCAAPAPRHSAPDPRQAAAAASRETLPAEALDRFLEESWRAAKVTPAPTASDGEFLRRASLDLVGRIPTLDEVKAFLADPSSDKRARAVDRMLASRGYAEHWGEIYAELLYGTEGKAPQIERQYDPTAWLVESFATNRPYDRLVWQLLTASGDLRESGAVAFLAARSAGGGGPEAVTGAAARLFLGLQIQCVQCHDHPYDPRWKQEDFYGMAAFFARTKVRQMKAKGGKEPPVTMSDAAEPGSMKMAKPDRTILVMDVERGEAKMRKPGSERGIRVPPRFLGRELTPRHDEPRRQALARAILGSDLFAKAMVARTWGQLFGRSLVDPWDDLGAENDPQHPPLLVKLAEDFRASGHDVKALLRKIALSAAYQRSSVPSATGDPEAAVRAFARMGVRPLSPEQLFRSLVAATGAPEMVGRRGGSQRAERTLARGFREYRFVFADDEMLEVNRFDGSMPQALLLLNGELTNGGTRAAEGGVLARILGARPEPEARLADMFLAAYARLPTAAERRDLLPELRGRAAYEDLYFALLTSTEAITTH